jgi:3-deoxy-manno-octulosonate cytidylyltransferase (CMP-KDO synthetase)
MKKIICVIPARMGSSRFPGKPLADILGLPMILHILDRCHLYKKFDRVIVATCDQKIARAVEAYGGEAVMTKDSHERCTDRVEEAIENLDLGLNDDDFVVMVQGDEIMVTPEMIQKIVDVYLKNPIPVVNLVSRLTSQQDIDDINTVKVVADTEGKALYFSRSPIPSSKRGAHKLSYQQTGIIGFAYSFLNQFSQLKPTPLEIIESVDMLRVIEHGHEIQLIFTDTETIGVDTTGDLAHAEKILLTDPTTKSYLKNYE